MCCLLTVHMSRRAFSIGVAIVLSLAVFTVGVFNSWESAAAISTTILGIVAIFSEEIRRWTFKPEVEFVEFPVAVADQSQGATKPVVHHHYLEIVNHGGGIDDVRVELLAVTFNPRDKEKTRTVRLPGVTLPLGSHLGDRAVVQVLRVREILKIGHISANEAIPQLVVNLEARHNPVGENSTDPHYRGRFHLQVTGRHFASDVWIIDYVRDGQLSSGWRLEVIQKQPEREFWSGIRNYIREFNENKFREKLP